MTPRTDAGYDPAPGPGRTLLVVFGTATVLFVALLATTSYAAYSLATHPWVEVRIAERDGAEETVRVSIPIAVAGTAVAVAPYLLPDEARRGLVTGMEGHEEWAPLVRELAGELARMPDATLVEIEGGYETVEVAKRGDDLVVHVRSPDADVDVSVPVALVEQVARSLE